MRLEDLLLISIGLLLLFIPLLVVVLIGRRVLRGEGLFTDTDWVFLFGKPKEEVLTETFCSKVGVAGIICLAVGFIEYYVLAPIGALWFVAAIVLTALGIAVRNNCNINNEIRDLQLDLPSLKRLLLREEHYENQTGIFTINRNTVLCFKRRSRKNCIGWRLFLVYGSRF